MNRIVLASFIILSVLSMLFNVKISVRATPGTIYVPANYPTIQEAINNARAEDTVLVSSGMYHEDVKVNKTVKLLGDANGKTMLDAGGKTCFYVTCDNVWISNFEIANGDDAVLLAQVTDCTVSNNTLTRNNGNGVYIFEGGDNTITANNLTENEQGIFIANSTNNIIICNSIINNRADGISLYDQSNENTIQKNLIVNCSFGIGLGQVAYNILEENKITSSENGLFIYESFYNTIRENNIISNNEGIVVSTSQGNCITMNQILDNQENGISMMMADKNHIDGNNIVNGNRSIDLSMCKNNVISRNNFINNTCELGGFLEELLGEYSNTWSNSGEGNYWSAYNGSDNDRDGVGEVPFAIAEKHQDNCPLMGKVFGFQISKNYYVNIISNSSVDRFEYSDSNSTIWIVVSGSAGTGFCRVCVPHTLVAEPYFVKVDGQQPLFMNESLGDNGTHRWMFIEYGHSTHEIVIAHTAAPWSIDLLSLLAEWWFWLILVFAVVAIFAAYRTRPKPPNTPLDNGEVVVKQFLGGRKLSEQEKGEGFFGAGSFSSGRWYITNRRLIYEGQTQSVSLKRALILPGWMKTDPDSLIYPLDRITDFRTVDEGTLQGKHVEVTVKDGNMENHVKVVMRKMEEFKHTLESQLNQLSSTGTLPRPNLHERKAESVPSTTGELDKSTQTHPEEAKPKAGSLEDQLANPEKSVEQTASKFAFLKEYNSRKGFLRPEMKLEYDISRIMESGKTREEAIEELYEKVKHVD